MKGTYLIAVKLLYLTLLYCQIPQLLSLSTNFLLAIMIYKPKILKDFGQNCLISITIPFLLGSPLE